MIPIRAQIEFLTDWHIGAGVSLGEADRAVVLDAEGLPYVPFSSIGRILAEHCEQLAVGLGFEPASSWHGVRALLGSSFDDDHGSKAEPGALIGAPLRLRPAVARHLTLHGLTAHVRHLRSQTRIDDATGVALDDHLRTIEVAPAGAVLCSDWWLDAEPGDESTIDALCLLLAGAVMIDAVGGKRRRGLGSCRVRLSDVAGADLVEQALLGQRLSAGLPALHDFAGRLDAPDKRRQPTSGLQASNEAKDGDPKRSEWVEIDLAIELTTPLSIKGSVTGNLQRGVDHIPGRTLLPMVLDRLAELVDDPGVALRHGDIEVAPATLEIEANRSVRLPFAIAEDRREAGRWANRIAQRAESAVRERRGMFVARTITSGPLVIRAPRFVVVGRNTTDRRLQRPIGPAGVHVTEQLAAGQVFRTVVRVRESRLQPLNEDRQTRLVDEFEGSARIGSRRLKGDQGEVRIEVRSITTGQSADVGFPAVVLCESDIVLDEVALVTGSALDRLQDSLRQQVDPQISIVRGDARGGFPAGAFVREGETSGWHAAWGLPATVFPTIAMGSIFVVDVPAPNRVTAGEALRKLADEGLGDRRAEGYGRVRVLGPADPLRRALQTNDVREAVTARSKVVEATDGDLSPDDEALLHRCEQSAWRTMLRVAGGLAARQAARSLPVAHLPLSQVGLARERLGATDDVEPLTEWIDHQLNRFRNESRRGSTHVAFYEWLRGYVVGTSDIWQAFGEEAGIPEHLRPDRCPAIDREQALEAYRLDALRTVVSALSNSELSGSRDAR